MNTVLKKREEDTAGRLSALKQLYPEAAEVLAFLGRIVDYQAGVAEKLGHTSKKVPGLQEIPWEDHMYALEDLIDICTMHGTEEIKNKAAVLKNMQAEEVASLLRDFVKGREPDNVTRFVLLCFMQPVAASVLALTGAHDSGRMGHCPVCGFPPAVSFIQDTAEVVGGRYLRCVLCKTDWPYDRTTCVSCGSNSDDSFDYFSDDKHACITIQACGKCSSYIKIIDTRIEGQAVPDLEDIATMGLDFWAQGRGLVKVAKNLIGM